MGRRREGKVNMYVVLFFRCCFPADNCRRGPPLVSVSSLDASEIVACRYQGRQLVCCVGDSPTRLGGLVPWHSFHMAHSPWLP